MTDHTTTRGLLEHHVKTLRLKPDAAFPSEAFNCRELIKGWQRAQQHVVLHAVRGVGVDEEYEEENDE